MVKLIFHAYICRSAGPKWDEKLCRFPVINDRYKLLSSGSGAPMGARGEGRGELKK